jgi:hypothetical protein
MPLTVLILANCAVRDLTPLAGMSLQEIFLPARLGSVKGVEVLRRMKTLRRIIVQGGKEFSPAEFWKRYDAKELGK